MEFNIQLMIKVKYFDKIVPFCFLHITNNRSNVLEWNGRIRSLIRITVSKRTKANQVYEVVLSASD